jgi:hypothetical protein
VLAELAALPHATARKSTPASEPIDRKGFMQAMLAGLCDVTVTVLSAGVERFFEPMMRVRLVVEPRDLAIPASPIEVDRLLERAVGLQPHHPRSRFPGAALELEQQPPSKTQPSRLWRHPHAPRLGRSAGVELERAAPDRLTLTESGSPRAGAPSNKPSQKSVRFVDFGFQIRSNLQPKYYRHWYRTGSLRRSVIATA